MDRQQLVVRVFHGQKQFVLQLPPKQQVVHVTILPLYVVVLVEHAA